jgi:hypothetical protein
MLETFPPIPFLADLREEVLQHSLKRMPKWRFRLAPDLVLQLQPKPTLLLSDAAMARGYKPKLHHFQGLAMMSEGSIARGALERLPRRPCSPWWRIKFELYAHDPAGDWIFYRTSWCRQRGLGASGAGDAGITTLTQHVVTSLHGGFFTGAMSAKMLSHHCVICGKGLSDPASMARWIGPECAGTSSLQVPFVIADPALAEPQVSAA